MHASPVEGLDLGPELQAGRVVLAGHGSIYSNVMFTYLPSSALIFTPVAHAGRSFFDLMSYVVTAAVVASVYVAFWAMIKRPWWLLAAAAMTLLVVTSKMTGFSGDFENLNMVLGLVGLWALLLMHHERWHEACLILAVSILFKPVLAPLLLVPIVFGKWKPALWAIVGICVITAVAAAAAPGGWNVLGLPRDLSRQAQVTGRGGQNLTLGYIASSQGLPSGAVLVLRALIAAAVAWVCFVGRRTSNAVTLGYAILLATMLVGNYFEISYVFLLAPVSGLAWAIRHHRIPAWGVLIGSAVLFAPHGLHGRAQGTLWCTSACFILASLTVAIGRSRRTDGPALGSPAAVSATTA